MVIRTSAQRPVKQALRRFYRHIVDAGEAALHQTIRLEFPVFITVRAIPVARIIMPFIGIAHGDTVFRKCPQLFDQTIIQLFFPFALQECLCCLTVSGKLRAVSPLGIQRIGKCDFGRVATVPAILCQSDFFDGTFTRKRR